MNGGAVPISAPTPCGRYSPSPEDGSQIKGRWFQQDHSEVGGDWTATRAEGAAMLLSVAPSALQAGKTQQVIVVGRGLEGTP